MSAVKIPEFQVDSLLTSYQVGALLQVNPSSVNKWVKDGRIPAFRTPGGHRRIRAGDLVAFLNQHKMPVPPSLAGASRRRMLIADEDGRHLETIAQALAPYTDQVELFMCSNGVDALVQVGALRPHLVVIGVRMPGIDGLEVCRRLRDGQETRQVGVVVVAAETSPELERQALAAGAKRVMRKPLDPGQLLAELQVVPSAA